ETEQHFQQGRLACTVRPDDADDLARSNFETAAVQDVDAREVAGDDVARIEHRIAVHHAVRPRRCPRYASMTAWFATISDEVPSAMTRPSAMQTTRSDTDMTTSMSCSTNITVRPSSRSPWMWPSKDCTRAGLTPAIGSSSMTSFGSAIRARAISSSL